MRCQTSRGAFSDSEQAWNIQMPAQALMSSASKTVEVWGKYAYYNQQSGANE